LNIRFERSGGFAGLRQTRSISSGELSAEEQKRLTDLVESARFFDLPAVLRSSTPQADRFQYKIGVETGQLKHTVQVDEAAVPDELQPLIAWLKKMAH
jgi:hypothetical protein